MREGLNLAAFAMTGQSFPLSNCALILVPCPRQNRWFRPSIVENGKTLQKNCEEIEDFGKAVSRILSAQPFGKPACWSRFDKGLRRESFVSAAGTRNPFRRAKRGAGSSEVPYLALHPMGFSVPHGLRRERWSLTPPFHPYPGPCKHEPGRYILCGTVRQDASRHHFPHISRNSWLQVTRHRALRCSDFPPLPSRPGRSDSPLSQNQADYTAKRWLRQLPKTNGRESRRA